MSTKILDNFNRNVILQAVNERPDQFSTKDVSNIAHRRKGDYELQIKDDSELEYILSLVRQSLKINTK